MDLTEFQERVIQAVLATKGSGRYSAQCAIRHLERAWALVDSMPEVAVFLAITAEEESATTVFHALKKRKYHRAEELRPKNHVQKHALHPFLLAIGEAFAPIHVNGNLSLYFEDDPEGGKPILRLRMLIAKDSERDYFSIPDPPLGWVSVKDGKPRDYTEELLDIARRQGNKNILEYIKKLANVRNQMLYASPGKIPESKNSKNFVTAKQSVVMSHLIAHLLIEPHREKQALAQDSLLLFLDMLRGVNSGEKQ